jgi:hypothetical protein
MTQQKRLQKELFLKDRADKISMQLSRVDELYQKKLEDAKDITAMGKVIYKDDAVAKHVSKFKKDQQDEHYEKIKKINEKHELVESTQRQNLSKFSKKMTEL